MAKESITIGDISDSHTGTLQITPKDVYDDLHVLTLPQYSDWECHCFGCDGDGIIWTPLKGKAPNWFWRKMQYLIFGNRWVKKSKK